MIRAFSHLEGCTIGPGCIVGPYARLRPGAELGAAVHVGNFVEVKAAQLGAGAKANHLTYLGDADGRRRQPISAPARSPAITTATTSIARRSARARSSAPTRALVAPVTVGDGAIVAAGSVITEDVPPDALAIARGRQVTETRTRGGNPRGNAKEGKR